MEPPLLPVRYTANDLDTLHFLFGSKWRPMVLHELLQGSKRLSELERLLPGCRKKILIDNLHALEKRQWIVRTDLSTRCRRVEYSLSDSQRRFIELLLDPE